jgi:hypothetical protein
MGFVFIVLFVTDIFVLLSSHFRNFDMAAQTCVAITPICDYRNALVVLAIVFGGVSLLQRT